MSEEENLIDPDVRQEIEQLPSEDPFLTEYASHDSAGDEKNDIAKDFLPANDDTSEKTRLTPQQVIAMSRASNMGDVFEELDDLQPIIDEQIEKIQKMSISLNGDGRSEFVQVLSSMFGEQMDDEMGGNAMMQWFAQAQDGDQNE